MNESTGIVERRRADRNFERDGEQLCQHLLDGLKIPGFDGYEVHVKFATEHRCGIMIRGDGLSDMISGTDPLKNDLPLLQCRPVSGYENDQRAVKTSSIVNSLSAEIRRRLRQHPVIEERMKQGQLAANVVLFRGCGMRIQLLSFKQRHPFLFTAGTKVKSFAIAPTCLINGLMKTIQFDKIIGKHETNGRLSGDFYTDIEYKFDLALEMLTQKSEADGYSFGFLHVKPVDDAGHDGLVDLKIALLERIDRALGSFVQKIRQSYIDRGDDEYYIAVTGDHTTPVNFGDHTCEPVPFLIAKITNVDSKPPNTKELKFDEISACRGGLGRFNGMQVFPIIKQFMECDDF